MKYIGIYALALGALVFGHAHLYSGPFGRGLGGATVGGVIGGGKGAAIGGVVGATSGRRQARREARRSQRYDNTRYNRSNNGTMVRERRMPYSE